MRVRIVTIIAALAALYGSTFAAESPYPELKSNPDCLSVDFPDEEITRILEHVAKVSNIRLVFPRSLTGRTSIKLRDVTWRQIFQVTLQTIDYTFIEYNDHVQVLTIKDADALPIVDKEIELYFQKPAEVVEYLHRNFGSKVTATPQATGLTVKVHPRFANRIFTHIEEIDKPEKRLVRYPRKPFLPQIIPLTGEQLVESKSETPHDVTTININGEHVLTTTEDIIPIHTEVFTIHWIDCDEVKVCIEKHLPKLTKVVSDARSNALVVTGTPKDLKQARSIIEYLDDKRWYDPATREKK